MINGGIKLIYSIIELVFFINYTMPVYTFNVNLSGDKYWYKNDKYHRNGDLPSIKKTNGDKIWYKNGKCHRNNNLPSIELSNRYKVWYQNDKQYFPTTCSINIITLIIKIAKMGNKWWYIALDIYNI